MGKHNEKENWAEERKREQQEFINAKAKQNNGKKGEK